METILQFAAALPVLVILFWVIPARARSGFLLLASLAFAAFFSWQAVIFFLLNLALVHRAGRYLAGDGDQRPQVFRLMLIWLVGSLCTFKYFNQLVDFGTSMWARMDMAPIIEGTIPRLAMPLGLSYVVFRMIHYTVERYRGRAPDSGFVDFGSYVLFFPTFLSGPVERFPAFHKQTEAQKRFDVNDINYGLFRIVSGLLKKFLAADPLGKLVLPVLKSPLTHGISTTWAALYGLAWQVYMDFSGYTDLALGVSRLFGYKVMENFNLPYFKPNLAEMWRNWHISVYSFIRDYFFFPFFGVRASFLKMQLGVILTFVVFMVWHEGSWRFLALGLYHGLGMVTWNVFQQLKRKNPSLRDLINHKDLKPLHTFFAFSFFGFGFVFFFLDVKAVVALLARLVM